MPSITYRQEVDLGMCIDTYLFYCIDQHTHLLLCVISGHIRARVFGTSKMKWQHGDVVRYNVELNSWNSLLKLEVEK